ncbi:stage II sporulation protein R [Candidatus Epulonipiscium viviparus]|uniref:stage II sporulation protein R n=1 Tax=Candidatus Epulonipiscium viviparus TaxID=420336 RepID=UPI00016BFB0B|nr:stage II sporulation protein R [Candidatus Epulopiscium viviparus]
MKIDKHTVILSAILVILFGMAVVFDTLLFAKQASELLKDDVIRFHVLANSDSAEDQQLKEEVRDAVMKYMEPFLDTADSVDESRRLLLKNIDAMQAVAENVVTSRDKNYDVRVEIAQVQFPTKKYGDIIFPAGVYEACRVLIGEASGANWWCVMFPPLCYVDASMGVLPLEGKEELEKNLTDAQYEIVAFQKEKPYKIRFKLLEWLEGVLN